MDEIVEQLRPLIEEVSSSKSVRSDTRLFHDLHLGGDDVAEILNRISAKYGTSFAGLSFTDFFHEEHEALGGALWASLGLRSSKKPVTVQHLAEVVRCGAWFDPPVS
jgi:hypothetical protein